MILVLIPHYNDLEGLYLSVKSIHHKDAIHVLIVDDGSDSNQIPKIEDLQKMANKNVSIFLEVINENKGITYALNYGLAHFIKDRKYGYIARLDCGDVCVKNRFSVQRDFLINNENVSMIGSWVKFKNTKDEDLFAFKPPVKHKKIKKKMSVRCNFIHPSVMMERKVIEKLGFYPDNYEAAEDYAYFYKISQNFETANINKFLTQVKVNPNGISKTKRAIQNKSKIKIIRDNSPKNLYFLYGMMFNYGLRIAPSNMVSRVKQIVMK
jgi:glycosyltransferase involved in cell wall biosynthesis